MSRVVGVIPARWASTRFPGKILHPLCGRPLLAWVLDRARMARRLDEVLVATDDERIRAQAESWGVEAVMTDPDLPSGTDRVAAALRGRTADVVINVQGDEPLIDPDLVDALASAMSEASAWDMATASAPVASAAERDDPSVVKVVCTRDGQALYFSRAVIPQARDEGESRTAGPLAPYRRHIGIYAYRAPFLERLVREPPCTMEEMERLEQLRALYLGARIRVIPVPAAGIGVDTPEDIPRAEALLRKAGLAP